MQSSKRSSKRPVLLNWLTPCVASIACLIVLVNMVQGCAPSQIKPDPVQQAPGASVNSQQALMEKQQLQLDRLEKQLAACRSSSEQQRIEIQQMKIGLLEKEARSRQLGAQLSFQKQTADEAVIEVVRAKAKLRSIESRAEAASTMAETEIAIVGMKELASAGTIGSSENLIKADTLLKMSTEEFKLENYGGALYLAEQAKLQIHSIKADLEKRKVQNIISGEVAFIPPLPLKLVKRSNLRAAPDMSSGVQNVLEKGALVIGYSHKDEWIRVNTEAGISGWIHQSLVDTR